MTENFIEKGKTISDDLALDDNKMEKIKYCCSFPVNICHKKYLIKITNYQAIFSIIAILYAMASIGDSAYYYFLWSVYKVEPSDLNFYTSFNTIAFIFKPIYGLLTDSVPIFGFRRKPYLIFFGIINGIMWIMMGLYQISAVVSTVFLMIINVVVGIMNSVTEALIVEDSQQKLKIAKKQQLTLEKDQEKMSITEEDQLEKQSNIQYKKSKAVNNVSLFFFIDSAVLIGAGQATGYMVEDMKYVYIFIIVAIFGFLMALTGLFLKEKKKVKSVQYLSLENERQKRSISQQIGQNPQNQNEEDNQLEEEVELQPSCKKQIIKLWSFISKRTIFLPLLFILVYGINPSTYTPMNYFYGDVLHFEFHFISTLGVVSSVATVSGVLLYNFWLWKYSFRAIMIASTIVGCLFNLLKLVLIFRLNEKIHIPDKYFAVIASLFSSTALEIQLMPILVLACNLCPKNIEAFIYGTIMALKDMAYWLSSLFGGFLQRELNITKTNFDNLWIIMTISAAFPLLPLVLLIFIKIKDNYKEEFNELEKKMKNFQTTPKYHTSSGDDITLMKLQEKNENFPTYLNINPTKISSS